MHQSLSGYTAEKPILITLSKDASLQVSIGGSQFAMIGEENRFEFSRANNNEMIKVYHYCAVTDL